MTAPTLTRMARLCDRCHHTTNLPDLDLGFGYSRDTDAPTAPTAIPDGVVGISLTGRSTHRPDHAERADNLGSLA